jgi:hypothetical protein
LRQREPKRFSSEDERDAWETGTTSAKETGVIDIERAGTALGTNDEAPGLYATRRAYVEMEVNFII